MASDGSGEVTIPEYFRSPNSADDFVIIVQGHTLHVSKGHLGFCSPVLSAMAFNEGFPQAKNGEGEFGTKTLEEVLVFMCWAFEIPHPLSDDKTYGKIGKFAGIAMEDIPTLLRLADEWQVERLQRQCRLVFNDYVESATLDKKGAVTALVSLEGLGLSEEELTTALNCLIKAGVTITDLGALDCSPEAHESGCHQMLPLSYRQVPARQIVRGPLLAGRDWCWNTTFLHLPWGYQ